MKQFDFIGHGISMVIALTVGYILLFHRRKIIQALLASNKEFWNKLLDFNPNEGMQVFVANILIPLMGICFILAGLIMLYKIIVHVFF